MIICFYFIKIKLPAQCCKMAAKWFNSFETNSKIGPEWAWVIPLIILDKFGIIKSLQRSPFPKPVVSRQGLFLPLLTDPPKYLQQGGSSTNNNYLMAVWCPTIFWRLPDNCLMTGLHDNCYITARRLHGKNYPKREWLSDICLMTARSG